MDLKNLINSLHLTAENLTSRLVPAQLDERDRLTLLAACDRLSRLLESPEEAISRTVFGTHQMSALTTAVKMGLFDAMITEQEPRVVRASELSAALGTDVLLIRRILRVLVSMGMVAQKGKEEFIALTAATTLTKGAHLLDGFLLAAARTQTLTSLPEHLAQTGFKNPDDARSGPFQLAMGTDRHYFDWLSTQPELQATFDRWMQSARQQRIEWFEYFPFESKIGWKDNHPPESDNRAVFVDVGGGHGAVIRALKTRFPDMAGRMILQDRACVLQSLSEHIASDEFAGIEIMAHDFFQTQPIRNARVYYLRSILHDWPNKDAHKILRTIRAAIDGPDICLNPTIEKSPPGSPSMVLIHEKILEDETELDCKRQYLAEIDLSMMATFSSLERTLDQWQELLNSAGLKLVRVWAPPEIEGKRARSERLMEAIAF